MAAIETLTRNDLAWVESILDRPGLAATLFGPHLDQHHLKIEASAFLLGNYFEDSAYLSYIYVSEAMRRHGLAGRLVSTFIEEARGAKLERVLVSGETGKAPGYIQPGIEMPKESGALVLLRSLGFQELDMAYSMSIELKAAPELPQVAGWEVGVATEEDRGALIQSITNSVPGEWERFFDLALSNSESKIVVVRNGALIGGYCHTQGNRFGPLGVVPSARGGGLGSLITIAALHEMRANGAKEASFTWSDAENLSFYQRVGFKVKHSFQRMQLLL